MPFISADTLSLTVFLAILLFVFSALIFAIHHSFKRQATTLGFALAFILWLALIGFAAQSGFLEAEPMPRLLIIMMSTNLIALVAALSPLGKRMVLSLPIVALVGFQAFRLPLELVLHAWVQQGVIPVTMTWNGSNFDIVSGSLALVLAPFSRRSTRAAWIFNVVGFALLINVMRVAVLSSPLPFAWGVNPPLALAFHLPYVWIVPLCVGGALFGHVVLTRALVSLVRPK